MIEDHRPAVVKPMLFEERAEQARRTMRDEGRKLLFTVSNIDQLRTRTRELPAGFGYIAVTGEVWGAPGSVNVPDPVPDQVPEDVPW
ncbi:hypothetical protein [Neorhizobium tomejilense]|uniref:hypothetical protein n=1 Tax=Neorhizobium tomejilense TaxID=2093828 RepID=UPI000CFA0866|nr:hypothetical protein [Neorhizobium tomejilense]